jgi:hypothetical protein
MFEYSASDPSASSAVPSAAPSAPQVLAPEGEPIEFIYRGHRFHIHNIVSRWQESGGWWNRISDGNIHDPQHFEQSIFNDGGRAIWRVEAAPVGALATFEIELDELTGKWIIRPTSRPA